MARATNNSETYAWKTVNLAPVIMLYGSEEFFALRAKERVRAEFQKLHDDVEIIQLNAKDYKAGQLVAETSPSLFGGAKIIEVENLATMNDAFLTDSLQYVQTPDTDSVVVMVHSGGNKGKKLLDTIRKSSHPFIETKPFKKDAEKLNFVHYMVKDMGRQIQPDAAQMLVSATGADVSELASACQQLVKDSEGTIDLQLVDKYYGNRVEVTAFKVSDAAVMGNPRVAMKLLRNALDTGVEPIPLVGALAARMRNISKVHGGGSSNNVRGMAPWQAQQALRESRRFSSDDLARIFNILAEADAALKGESAAPDYVLEKAVLAIATAGR